MTFEKYCDGKGKTYNGKLDIKQFAREMWEAGIHSVSCCGCCKYVGIGEGRFLICSHPLGYTSETKNPCLHERGDFSFDNCCEWFEPVGQSARAEIDGEL